jgi:hypothetical protein
MQGIRRSAFSPDSQRRPILSLILCSRNDQYMGNSLWRLETSLNYVSDQARKLGRTKQVEVLVADWGSEVPLRDAVRLTPAAAEIVSFLWISPDIARDLQKDSSFPEVLALNAVARRASGEYIGRIDQDTLVGNRFLEVFFDHYEGRRQFDTPLCQALLYSNRREIPYRFAVKCPPYHLVERYIKKLGDRLPVRHDPRRPFWTYLVGIWLVHRALWHECGGYNERLIYYNWMEVDMILRLKQKYTIIDFGVEIDYSFFHLEHVHPRIQRSTIHSYKNPKIDFSSTPTLDLKPNGNHWGIVSFPIDVMKGSSHLISPDNGSRMRFINWVGWSQFVLDAEFQIMGDNIISFMHLAYIRWSRSTSLIIKAVSGKPLIMWPRALMDFWMKRRAG